VMKSAVAVDCTGKLAADVAFVLWCMRLRRWTAVVTMARTFELHTGDEDFASAGRAQAACALDFVAGGAYCLIHNFFLLRGGVWFFCRDSCSRLGIFVFDNHFMLQALVCFWLKVMVMVQVHRPTIRRTLLPGRGFVP